MVSSLGRTLCTRAETDSAARCNLMKAFSALISSIVPLWRVPMASTLMTYSMMSKYLYYRFIAAIDQLLLIDLLDAGEVASAFKRRFQPYVHDLQRLLLGEIGRASCRERV